VKSFLLSACAALILLAPASDAAAKSIKIQASGTVAWGMDGAGLFGATGANLTGRSFSFETTFDLTNAYYGNYGFRTDLVGGEAYDYLPGPTPPSLGNAVFALNGVQQAIHANWNTGLTALNGFGSNFDQQYVQERHESPGYLFAQAVTLVEQPGFGVFGPDYVPPSGNLCAAGHTCNTSNFSYTVQQGGSYIQTFAQLDPSSITISVLPESSATPEPASWALMLTGFGLGGAALRSRRKTLAA
jgi:hypothetical protein